MGRRAEKIILATVAVASVYAISAYAACGDPRLCRDIGAAAGTAVPGQFVLALLPTAAFAFWLLVDTIVPIRESVLDIAHEGLTSVHRHLFVDGERDDYWHLRLTIGLAAIVITQLLVDAVDALHAG